MMVIFIETIRGIESNLFKTKNLMVQKRRQTFVCRLFITGIGNDINRRCNVVVRLCRVS